MAAAKPGTKKAVVRTETKSALLAAYAGVLQEAQAEFEQSLADQAAQYDLDMERKREQDEYDFNIRKRDREDQLTISLNARTAAVQAREDAVAAAEAALKANEKHYAELQATVDGFAGVAEQIKIEAYESGKAAAEANFNTQVTVLKAEHSASEAISRNKIYGLEAANEAHVATIASLRQELQEANKRVETVATNAVQAAGQSKVTVQNTPAGR